MKPNFGSRISLTLMLAVAAALLAAVSATTAQGHRPKPGPWQPATELTELTSPKRDGCPFPTRDGLSLYIASDREGGFGGLDIWVSTRPSNDAPWGAPVNLGPQINTSANEFCPSPDRGGRFMFVSDRNVPGVSCGGDDIYATRFRHGEGWKPPRNLGCEINSPQNEAGPIRVGHELYFSSTRLGSHDIYVSRVFRHRIGSPAPIAELNSPLDDARPFVRRDGLEIVFDSNREGSLGRDIWSATRRHRWAPWSPPVDLGEAVNSAKDETRPSISPDGSILYFGSTRGASQDVYFSTRER